MAKGSLVGPWTFTSDHCEGHPAPKQDGHTNWHDSYDESRLPECDDCKAQKNRQYNNRNETKEEVIVDTVSTTARL
jgi:hypothetical protein